MNGKYPGRKPGITNDQKVQIIELVKEKRDITLEEIIQKFDDLPIKKSRVSKILLEEKMFF